MRSCLVMAVLKMKSTDQVLNLPNCSAPFTDVFISVHEKAAAKLVMIGLML